MMPKHSTTVWIEVAGKTRKVVLGDAVTVDGVAFAVDAREPAPDVLSLLWTLDGTARSFRCVADPAAGESAVLVDGERFPYALDDPRCVRGGGAGGAEAGPKGLKLPMPGRILRVLVSAGDTVECGQGCVMIEAMKMQNELKAPCAGVVAALAAKVGETVAAGAPLLVVV